MTVPAASPLHRADRLGGLAINDTVADLGIKQYRDIYQYDLVGGFRRFGRVGDAHESRVRRARHVIA